VILKAMAAKITWPEAAEIIGVCDPTMRRMRERYQESAYDGLLISDSGQRHLRTYGRYTDAKSSGQPSRGGHGIAADASSLGNERTFLMKRVWTIVYRFACAARATRYANAIR
jgi:hypothetical protein